MKSIISITCEWNANYTLIILLVICFLIGEIVTVLKFVTDFYFKQLLQYCCYFLKCIMKGFYCNVYMYIYTIYIEMERKVCCIFVNCIVVAKYSGEKKETNWM